MHEKGTMNHRSALAGSYFSFRKDTLNMTYLPSSARLLFQFATACLILGVSAVLTESHAADSVPQEYADDQIVIVEGEDRTIYEYRQNGVLTMIKIVPKKGRPYYMVPADGAPVYESLDHKRKLYPRWVIAEW
jgi:hypothetical protein